MLSLGKRPRSYRQYTRTLKKTPRQTEYNRKLREQCSKGPGGAVTSSGGADTSSGGADTSLGEADTSLGEADIRDEASQCGADIQLLAVEDELGGAGYVPISDPEVLPESSAPDAEVVNEVDVGTAGRCEKLYQDAHLCSKESNLLVMAFSKRHGLSGVATDDLLKLISLHCPMPNRCCPSVFLLQKEFQLPGSNIQFHYYCPACFTPLQQQSGSCPNEYCGCKPNEKADNFFLCLSVENQIKSIFST